MKINQLIGASFLALQIAMIVYAQFIPERYFCWAPYDEQTYYTITAVIDGKPLSRSALGKRYRYMSKGWESRTIQNVFDMIQTYETTYGKNDNAQVRVDYQTNGHPVKQWRFPKELSNE